MSVPVLFPPRIARLERDARGYPIPWNVLRGDDGTPFFTVNDDRKRHRALCEELCPICGERLGRWKWFVGGPLSAFDPNGWFIDLPMHAECARFALATCPYLAAPKWLAREEKHIPHADKLPAVPLVDPTLMPDRPELFVAIASAKVEINGGSAYAVRLGDRVLPLGAYLRPARPVLDYEFWRQGEPLPLAAALPILREVFGPDWFPPERSVNS